MKYLLLIVFFITTFYEVSTAQNSTINTPAAGIVSTDNFQYNSYTVSNYGLGWYRDPSPSGSPFGYLSGWAGIKLFTQSQPRVLIDLNGNFGLGSLTPTNRNSYTGITINNATNGGFIDLAQAGTVRGTVSVMAGD